MTIAELREYARIDDDETDAQVELFRSAGISFVEKAVGEYDSTKELHKLLALSAATYYYDNRQMYVTAASQKKLANMYRSIILQCQLDLDDDAES